MCVRHPRPRSVLRRLWASVTGTCRTNACAIILHGARRAHAHMHAHTRAHAGALTARPQWVRAPGASGVRTAPDARGRERPARSDLLRTPEMGECSSLAAWPSGRPLRATRPPAGPRVRPHRHIESHVPMRMGLRADQVMGPGYINPHWVRDHHPGYQRRCPCMLVRTVPSGMMSSCPLA